MYAPELVPFLNTNTELDLLVGGLWSLARQETPDMGLARRLFLKACLETPNVGRPDSYVPHCFEVSRRCDETVAKILENYPFLKDTLNPAGAAFAGLIEDSVYLIGGNGKNNPNELDSNPYHEILTLAQMNYMGFDKMAEGMAMHGVAPQILQREHEEGRLQTITFDDKPRPMLDILTGIDMLCTTYYLPMEFGGNTTKALEYRMADLIKRRNNPAHPLVIGLQSKEGRARVFDMVDRTNKLVKREYSPDEVARIYSLS